MKTVRVIVALAALLATSAIACDCATLSVQKREQESESIFVGQVVRHEPLKSIELRVVEAFKGEANRTVTVPTGVNDCDYFVKPVEARAGERFLVFLTKSDGGLSINRCLGTAPLAGADKDLAYLRARRPVR
jgi:hypothetical protein